MKTKHTQGEWRTVYEPKNGTVIKVGDKTIVKVFRNKNLIEINANAKLIANAPELLDKLFNLIQSIEMQHVNASADYIENLYPGFVGAIKSIKKATE